MAWRNSSLGGAEIPVLLRNGRPQLVGPRWIYVIQPGRNGGCFVRAAAHDSRRLTVKLTQVRQGFGVVGVQIDGPFELRTRPFSEPVRGHEGRLVRGLTESAPQPKMLHRVLIVQIDRLLAFMYSRFKLFEREKHAALDVVRLCRCRLTLGQGLKDGKRPVRLARLQRRVCLRQSVICRLRKRMRCQSQR